jgi:competence ComEA-like helix-hairpin-helix protein
MFNFTREERKVILFLIIVALAGAGINFLAKKFAPVRAIACVNPALGKINVNTADKQTLKILPGVGDKLADRILGYREKNGKFSEPEDLKGVKGFNNRTLERSRELIIFE